MLISYVNNIMSTQFTAISHTGVTLHKQQDIGKIPLSNHHMLKVGKHFLFAAASAFSSSLFCPKFHFRYFYHEHQKARHSLQRIIYPSSLFCGAFSFAA